MTARSVFLLIFRKRETHLKRILKFLFPTGLSQAGNKFQKELENGLEYAT
jgi:hypothetical protein